MEFKGFKIDFIGLGQAMLGIAALYTAIKGAQKSKAAQDKKKDTEKDDAHE